MPNSLGQRNSTYRPNGSRLVVPKCVDPLPRILDIRLTEQVALRVLADLPSAFDVDYIAVDRIARVLAAGKLERPMGAGLGRVSCNGGGQAVTG